MKTIRIIIFFLFLSSFVFLNKTFGQNYIQYYNIVNEAEYWLSKKYFDNAILLYLKAFKIESPLPKDCFLLAKCYAVKGKKNECLRWLKISSNKRVSFTSYSLNKESHKTAFENVFRKEKELENLTLELRKLENTAKLAYKDSIYLMLQDTVNKLCSLDQKYRKKKNFKNWSDENRRLFRENDSIVQFSLLALTKQHGFPGYFRTGTDIADVILVHTIFYESIYTQFERILFKEVKKGNLLPFGYAYMVDRWHLRQNKSCFLAMRIYTKKLCNESDYENIIKRKLEIGLSIYFTGPRKKDTEPYSLHPWVNDQFVSIHSFLK